MSSPKVEIVNPIRFFSFFGLFLIFLFLAFRSCSDKEGETKYVEAEKISDASGDKLKKTNTEELSNFITDIKKDLKNSDQIKEKDLTAEQLAKLEDQNSNAKKEKLALEKKMLEQKKRQAQKKRIIKKAAVSSKQKIIVKGENGKLDEASKAELKRVVTRAQKSFSKIMIYGYYGMNQPKGSAFIKAAEIKNTLIDLGVKRSIPIYMLTEQTRIPNGIGKVIFSK